MLCLYVGIIRTDFSEFNLQQVKKRVKYIVWKNPIVKLLRDRSRGSRDTIIHLFQIAARPGSHKMRCLYRVVFMPTSAAQLAQRDLAALDYLYLQCCNDVAQDRFAPELQPDVALRLAALHMHQHALANNLSPGKLTVKAVE